MAVNKVVYGGTTLVDLTSDSVTPETLLEGTTAHNAAGERIVGKMPAASNLLFPPTADWMATKIYTSNYTLGGYSFENNQFYGFITGGRVAAGMVTTSLKNLSGINAITIEFEVTGSAYLDASAGQMVFYLRTSQTGSNILDKVVSQEELASGTVTIDVSSYNSSYYLLTGIAIWGSAGEASLTVKEVRYE